MTEGATKKFFSLNQPYTKKFWIDFQNFWLVFLVKPLELCFEYDYCIICPKIGFYGHWSSELLKKNIKLLGYKGDHLKYSGLLNLKTYSKVTIDITIKNNYHLLKSAQKFFTKSSENEYFHLLVKLP